MNKRISRNGITVIAKAYADLRVRLEKLDSPPTPQELFDEMVGDLADMLEGDNDNFDRDRFFKAIYHGKG